jgi:ribulose-phosphate 3-epimerase
MKPVVPALIPTSAEVVRTTLALLSFSREVHLDVVDGAFVPFVSWPYTPPGEPAEVMSTTDRFTLEVDLMVSDPLSDAEAWVKAGADMLVFHVETVSLPSLKAFRSSHQVSIIVSALNDTPLETLSAYAAEADGVQLMGIAAIGAQGQPFDRRVLTRISEVKKQFPRLPITVDGSVNETTITELSRTGADRFICGSAIIQAAQPAEAYQRLRALTV